jgi:hypothetical protein
VLYSSLKKTVWHATNNFGTVMAKNKHHKYWPCGHQELSCCGQNHEFENLRGRAKLRVELALAKQSITSLGF